MDVFCCACGVELPSYKAIESELERREEEARLGIEVPIIGIVCTNCEVLLQE